MKTKITISQTEIEQSFNISGKPILMKSGEGRTYKVGNLIVKHINNDSRDYWNWGADLFNTLEETEFRIPRPIKKDGDSAWVTPTGWTAWTLLAGNHNYKGHIPEIIKAVNAFHKSIAKVEKPAILESDSPYYRADQYAFSYKPDYIHPQVNDLVDKLYSLRKPVSGLSNQLIHGDINPDNILIAPDQYPAIIDMAAYWRPSEFALAVFAYWIGPWCNDLECMKYFKDVAQFDQMLIRAGIRMLLIMSEFGKVTELKRYIQATELICKYVTTT